MTRTRKRVPPPAPAPPPPAEAPAEEFFPQQEGYEPLPPHSVEAEQGVLGCIMLDPVNTIGDCIGMFAAGPVVFYDLRHRMIYQTLVEMYDKGSAIDLITVHQLLRDRDQLTGVGGLAYLASLPDHVPSAANLPYYTEIVLKKYILRQLISAATVITEQAKKEPENVSEMVAQASASIELVGDASAKQIEVATPKTLVPEAMAHIEHLKLNAGKVTGLATGLVDLDALTWGLQRKEMIILAARPSVGKTALAMNIAEHVALGLKIPVGVFSLEMGKESLMVRMLCSRAKVSSAAIRKGVLSNFDQDQLVKAATDLIHAPIYIDDTSGLSILQLRARARRMVKLYGIKLFIVDYLQLMTAQVKRNDNRQQEVTYISSGLKGLAKEEDVAVLALSQLSRKMDDRGTHAPPKLSDLRESGAIEQDADVVLMLYRPKDPAKEAGVYQDSIAVKAIVSKNRNGPTGEVDLAFFKAYTRFESTTKVYPAADEEPPNLDLA